MTKKNKDIVIKVKENDDRKVLFKLPYSIDATLNMVGLPYHLN